MFGAVHKNNRSCRCYCLQKQAVGSSLPHSQLLWEADGTTTGVVQCSKLNKWKASVWPSVYLYTDGAEGACAVVRQGLWAALGFFIGPPLNPNSVMSHHWLLDGSANFKFDRNSRPCLYICLRILDDDDDRRTLLMISWLAGVVIHSSRRSSSHLLSMVKYNLCWWTIISLITITTPSFIRVCWGNCLPCS